MLFVDLMIRRENVGMILVKNQERNQGMGSTTPSSGSCLIAAPKNQHGFGPWLLSVAPKR
jgi:hypothetical protein